MARARAQGRRVSRPPIPEATRRRIEELAEAGRSINSIAKELKIAYGTAARRRNLPEPARVLLGRFVPRLGVGPSPGGETASGASTLS